MLDLFSIFSKGGIVLWCFQSTSEIFSPSVNALIRSVILQVSSISKLGSPFSFSRNLIMYSDRGQFTYVKLALLNRHEPRICAFLQLFVIMSLVYFYCVLFILSKSFLSYHMSTKLINIYETYYVIISV